MSTPQNTVTDGSKFVTKQALTDYTGRLIENLDKFEQDPGFMSSPAASITQDDIDKWNRGGGSTSIDDSQISSNTTWSSEKINTELDKKANTADIPEEYDDTEIKNSLNNKADKATTLAGYGITDAISNDDPRLTDARPASDVKDWAKADKKPSYTAAEVGALADSVTHLSGDVPTSRTINGKALTENITLSASDIGAATEEFVTNIIDKLPAPMVFKGSIGTNGTITALPPASKENEGYTYRVITDGTYGSQAAKDGDVFISNGSSWIYIPSADDAGGNGTVTNVAMTVPTGLKVTGSPITSNGTLAISYASGYSIPTTAKQAEWDGYKTVINSLPTSYAPIDAQKNIQSDWNETDETSDAYIKNKPTITGGGSGIPIGVCETPRATNEKAVTLNGFVLSEGAVIAVKFTTTTSTASTGAISLNVNDTGAKSIGYVSSSNGASVSSVTNSTYFGNNTTHIFMYNGNYWVMLDYNYYSDTDAYVRQYKTATNNDYSILTRYNTNDVTTSDTTYARYAKDVTVNPSTGNLKVTQINGVDVGDSPKFTDTVLTDNDISNMGFTKNTGTYSKPSTGIPKTDLASAVQTSLGKADTALQSFTETDPVFSASPASGITSAMITAWNKAEENVQADWNETSTTSDAFIKNKPTISQAAIGQGYGTCTTAATTTAKVVTLNNYVLSTNGIVAVKFTYAVPANATMNINSKGAKSIYYRGAAITAGIISAGDIATFIYDGTRYQLIAVDKSIDNSDNDTTYTLTQDVTDGHKITLTSSTGTATTITIPDNNTDTKVTAVGNHYTPTKSTTKSASDGTLIDITNLTNGTQVVTGVEMDAAGHVTGIVSKALKSTGFSIPIYTAYTKIGSATKIPQITTNVNGFVTKIEEVDITETDPVFSASAASSVTVAQLDHWNTHYANRLRSMTITPKAETSFLYYVVPTLTTSSHQIISVTANDDKHFAIWWKNGTKWCITTFNNTAPSTAVGTIGTSRSFTIYYVPTGG